MSNSSEVRLADPATILVGGEWRAGDGVHEAFDPSNLSRQTGSYGLATEADVADAYAAAAAAQPQWAGTTAPARARLLRRIGDLLEANSDEAAHALTSDMGKVIRDARGEVLRSAAVFHYHAGEILMPRGEIYPSESPDTFLYTVERPLGVVCAITPWNFPFAIPAWKLAPAIGLGNTVVWKPALDASGSAVFLARLMLEAGLPAGVVNLITGRGGALSGALSGDPRLAGVTFTGSGPVGAGLRQAVADRNVKVQLELGGKNPIVVLADADLGDAAQQIAKGAMFGTGQRCTASSRLYVESPVADELTARIVAEVERLRVGDPFDPSVDVGPLSSPAQHRKVGEYLDLARAEGADSLIGGGLEAECFVQPTVLRGVSAESRLLREEIFGPVLAIEEVADFDAAVASANDTSFGLSSSVFTADLAKALAFTEATESGMVHVNRETGGVEAHVPFGGIKESSNMSREHGPAARHFFTTTKTVYVRTPG
ncbi:MAG: aldehyde dehydrogenase family protein [Solirubrobacterales bacterium]